VKDIWKFFDGNSPAIPWISDGPTHVMQTTLPHLHSLLAQYASCIFNSLSGLAVFNTVKQFWHFGSSLHFVAK